MQWEKKYPEDENNDHWVAKAGQFYLECVSYHGGSFAATIWGMSMRGYIPEEKMWYHSPYFSLQEAKIAAFDALIAILLTATKCLKGEE